MLSNAQMQSIERELEEAEYKAFVNEQLRIHGYELEIEREEDAITESIRGEAA